MHSLTVGVRLASFQIAGLATDGAGWSQRGWLCHCLGVLWERGFRHANSSKTVGYCKVLLERWREAVKIWVTTVETAVVNMFDPRGRSYKNENTVDTHLNPEIRANYDLGAALETTVVMLSEVALHLLHIFPIDTHNPFHKSGRTNDLASSVEEAVKIWHPRWKQQW